MTSKSRLLYSIVVLCLLQGATSIKNARLHIPEAVQAGQTARLVCLFDLEGAPLYSLKWYRGSREFYRYVPKEVPPIKLFPFPGINVDLSQSSVSQVALREVQVSLSGNFSCEVSADAPSFSTAFVSHYMTVVDLPEKRPIISVEKSSFQAGQPLAANCTSLRSRPPANLTFYINDVPVAEDYVSRASDENSSWLAVVSPVSRGVHQVRLKCVASVLMFHRHAELILEEERPQLLVLGAREQMSSMATSIRITDGLVFCILLLGYLSS